MSILISIQAVITGPRRHRSRYVITFDPSTLKVTDLYAHSFSPAHGFGILPVELIQEALDQELLHPKEEAFWRENLAETPRKNLTSEQKKHFDLFLSQYVSLELPKGRFDGGRTFSLLVKSLGSSSRLSTPMYRFGAQIAGIHDTNAVSFTSDGSSTR